MQGFILAKASRRLIIFFFFLIDIHPSSFFLHTEKKIYVLILMICPMTLKVMCTKKGN
ncbi:hypothetical protein EDC94DRAFT_622112 [Helicostylum pulchrum]|nr:hypothetical protein EDC94DRAFT_622112 [Helicostylum pulchrum]